MIIIMGLFGPYVYKDKATNKKWWLHSRTQGKTTFYYFSKESEDAMMNIPGGYEVLFHEQSGIPMLRKIAKRQAKAKAEKAAKG